MTETVLISFKEICVDAAVDGHHVLIDLDECRKTDSEFDVLVSRLANRHSKHGCKDVPSVLISTLMRHVKTRLDSEKLIVPHALLHKSDDLETLKENNLRGTNTRKITVLFLDYLKANEKLKEQYVRFKGYKVVEDQMNVPDFEDEPWEFEEEPMEEPVEEPLEELAHCSKCEEKDNEILRLKRQLNATRKRYSRESYISREFDEEEVNAKRSCQESHQAQLRTLETGLVHEKLERATVQTKNDIVASQLDDFAKRRAHNEISPSMVQYIIENLVGNHMSLRQVEGSFNVMVSALPMLKKYKFPSTGTVQKGVWSIPTLNDLHAVAFFNESTTLCISSDGSKKADKDILAVLVVNELGKKFLLDARECFSANSEDHAEGILDMLVDLGNRAEALGAIDEGAAWPWVQTQLSKIVMAISDSCHQALNVRKRLIALVREATGNPEQAILSADCSMHQISNAEKHAASCLSNEAKTVLKLANEVLGSSSLNSHKNKWDAFIEASQFRFRCEVGLRFGCKGHNGEVLVLKWDDVKSFCLAHPMSPKLHQLQLLMTSTVYDEITAFACVWGVCLAPLWNRLRTSNVVNSIMLLDKFVTLAEESNVRCPTAVMTDITFNKCIADTIDGSVLVSLKEGSTSQLMFQHLSLLEIDEHRLVKSSLIAMLNASASYVRSLRRNWMDYDDIPHGLQNIGFTQQPVEQYFGVLDYILKCISHACIFTRTELARGIFNRLHTYIQSIEEEQRSKIVMKAYRHANDIRLGARHAEAVLAEAQMSAESQRFAAVQHEYGLVEQCYNIILTCPALLPLPTQDSFKVCS